MSIDTREPGTHPVDRFRTDSSARDRALGYTTQPAYPIDLSTNGNGATSEASAVRATPEPVAIELGEEREVRIEKAQLPPLRRMLMRPRMSLVGVAAVAVLAAGTGAYGASRVMESNHRDQDARTTQQLNQQQQKIDDLTNQNFWLQQATVDAGHPSTGNGTRPPVTGSASASTPSRR